MAASFVQVVSTFGTSPSVSATITGVNSANLLVIMAVCGYFPTSSTPPVIAVTDNGVTLGSAGASVDNAGVVYVSCFLGGAYGALAAGSHPINVTITAGGGTLAPEMVLYVAEYSGADSSTGWDYTANPTFPGVNHADPNQFYVLDSGLAIFCSYNPVTGTSASVDNGGSPPPSSWTTRAAVSLTGTFSSVFADSPVATGTQLYTGNNVASSTGSTLWEGFNWAINTHAVMFRLHAAAGGGGIVADFATTDPQQAAQISGNSLPAGGITIGHALNCNDYPATGSAGGANFAPGHGILITQN